jgi:hypothetical protein
MNTHNPNPLARTGLLLCALAVGACEQDAALGRIGSALTVECADPAALPDDAWLCPASRTLECGETDAAILYLTESADPSCSGETLVLSDAGPFTPGTHTLDVRSDDDSLLCSAELTVVDSEAPVLTVHTQTLWPPNHKLQTIDVADCVSVDDACDGELRGEFIWASSDEPVDAKGDGHHQPDIVLGDDCQTVELRAERQGGMDGRVYTLGVRVVDAAGHEAEAECQVVVAHDQSGVPGADSGEAYRLVFDGSEGGPICDGRPDGSGLDGGSADAGNSDDAG